MRKWEILCLILILIAVLAFAYSLRDAETPCQRLARYDAVIEDGGRLTPLQLEAYPMLSTLRGRCLRERAAE